MTISTSRVEQLEIENAQLRDAVTIWQKLADERKDQIAAQSERLIGLSESKRGGWVPVSEGLPADQTGGWLVFNTDTGKLWFETNLPSWWNRKDPRGKEFDGPAVTHWREDFYPLPGPRK